MLCAAAAPAAGHLLNPDLQKKNICAGEMSPLPLLKIQFVFNLVYLIPVVLLL
jgi:hypothetical protein